jgi:hypothetical protein
VSGIFPSRVFLARTTQVTLSGYATHWSGATKVDFGPGITVHDLVAASPTALVAQVATTKGTPVGVRDVVVEDGSSRQRYTGAFAVASPLTASFQGTMAQGALGRVTLRVLDPSTPLDTTAVRDIAGNVSYPDLAVTLPPGIGNVGIATALDYEVTFAIGIDVDANAATGDVDLLSGPEGSTTEFPLPSGIQVAARTATPLVSGVVATGTTTNAYDSVLYAFTPTGGMAILDLAATATNGALDPAVAMLPSSGHFADLLGFGNQQTAVAPAGAPLYAVYWENTGGTGPFEVKATATDVAQSAMATAADALSRGAGAIPVTGLPFVLTDGDLARNSFDWVKLTVAGTTTLRVQTTGDLATDTRVTAYQSDGLTVVATPIDTGYAADGTIPLTVAGTYYVEFSQGQNYVPGTPHTKYTAIIRVD